MNKMKAKGRAIMASASAAGAPDFNIMNYKLSMMENLSYYNREVDTKKKQDWAIAFWKKQGKDVKGMERINDSYFGQAGAIAHMIGRNLPLDKSDEKFLDIKYNELKEKIPPVAAPKVTVQERIVDLSSRHIAEFEGALADFCFVGTDFDPKTYLAKNEVKAPVAMKIAAALKPQLKEYEEALAGKDPQLNEGYSNFDKKGLKRVIEFLKGMISACDNAATIARTMRAPRVRKSQPPSKVVSKMKYMKEFSELKMKSIDPTKVVGAIQVWIYNTKLRKLFKYDAIEDMSFTVKGTTLQNFDPEKSGSKMIRKPEVTLKGVGALTKRPINNLYNEVKAVPGKATGRITDDYIIVSAF